MRARMGAKNRSLTAMSWGAHQESQLDGNAPPLQWGGRHHPMFSRTWDWFFGVEEGVGNQEESLRNDQGLQHDSKSGCVD